MPVNHVLLETIELSQSAASVTFDNIPQTGYTDLKLVISGRGSTTSPDRDAILSNIKFNNTSTTYTSKWLRTQGTVAASFNGAALAGYVNSSSWTASTFNNTEIYIPNYKGSQQKVYAIENAAEQNVASYDAMLGLGSGLWNGTGAITQITFALDYGSFVSGSTFSLYGVAELDTTPVTAPKAQGGNIVANDGTYWYHAFLASGTFTPTIPLTCDYLVVAGGGSGANAGTGGGGGGAGGLRSTVTATGGGGSLESALALAANTAYTVTIGAGGAQPSGNTSGNNGSNSVFASITATGGGAGARDDTNGFAGGSGGGASSAGGVGRTGGAGTSGQGYAGGNSIDGSGSNRPNGGGGGAGAVGVNGTTGNSGAGGAGVSIPAFATATNTGVSNFYAGGGGGGIGALGTAAGLGGSGGGGRGNKVTGALAVAGTVNTGGGGGGIDTVNSGGGSSAGGSGIVIIRYAMA
jgi:hypothetical protein